jgi:simple sugar transport system permease protein
VYAAHFLVVVVWVWVFKSRYGKVLIGLGENPDGLYRRGYRTTLIRYFYLILGGLLTGIAGFIYVFTVEFGWRGATSNLVGIGWFVFALLMIGNWRPFQTMFYAYLYVFMGLALQLFQASQTIYTVQAFNLLPQGILILLLAVIHIGKRRWMITPINKILSQEYTFIRSLNDTMGRPITTERNK